MHIDNIISEAKNGVEQLAKNIFGEFLVQAEEDFIDFANETKSSLENWANAAANGQLSKEELAFLIKMRADLAEMHSLTALGIAHSKLEKFRRGVISLLVRAVMSAI